MKYLRIFLNDLRTAILLLTFAPFLLLSTVAQGTMVQANSAGIQIVLCQGSQLSAVVVGDDPGQETPLHNEAMAQCAWAISSVDVNLVDAHAARFDRGDLGLFAGFNATQHTTDFSFVGHPVRGPPFAEISS